MSTLAARLAVARRKAAFPTANGFALLFASLHARFDQWRRDKRSRTELARMSARELRDIGITSAERERECGERFWQF
ncbi:MAG TPA: DUF1127 domain-containing protein [Stellaceae bacterium]|jgi:uncharacterized protein YjiS (DUF1127 family)|nr:DUF1127 domain-containing protein [Stellaceae bacterium]